MNTLEKIGLLFVAALGFIMLHYISSDSEGNRYVDIVAEASQKTVMLSVPTVITQTYMEMTKNEIKLHSSTVTVKMQGSGVFISKSGHILTCAHMFEPGAFQSITVILKDGRGFPAKLIHRDDERDLALIKIEGTGYVDAQLTASVLKVGQEVIAIGNPHGLEFSVSHGIISHLDRDIREAFLFTQVDAPINTGNSGGPLFNMNGELVGINARTVPNTDGLAFSISPVAIQTYLNLFQGI